MLNSNGSRFTSGEREGQSVSAISRELELDRKTVRRRLQQASWQPYRRADAGSLLDAHREVLIERAPQVNYSSRILWQELRSQHAFTGSYVIVRRAVAPLRMAASVAALTQRRFETGPGEQTQCDWAGSRRRSEGCEPRSTSS